MPLLRGALFLGGPSAASQTALEHRFMRLPCGFSANNAQSLTDDPGTIGIDRLAAASQIAAGENWWTGEDSNLRSPQGAADLQSAGFSHSPTRPRNSFERLTACLENSCQQNSASRERKHKTDSCQKTPARRFRYRGFAPPHSPAKILVELAEGIEPPTL
jgi:hypothetical protein